MRRLCQEYRTSEDSSKGNMLEEYRTSEDPSKGTCEKAVTRVQK